MPDLVLVNSLLAVLGLGVLAGMYLTPGVLIVCTVVLAVIWCVIVGVGKQAKSVTLQPWLFAAIPLFLIGSWLSFLISSVRAAH